MTSDPVPNTLWENVASLLIPFEGSASQLYVLDLPLASLRRTIKLFCDHVGNCRIRSLDGMTYGQGETLRCVEANISRVEVGVMKNELSIFDGLLPNARSLSLFVWPNIIHSCFDAELVFWADEFFNDTINASHRKKSFESVYSIAESFRANSPHAQCVLTQSETGDPRNDMGHSWSFFW